MTYDLRVVITDEIPGVKTVVARAWLAKEGDEKVDEKAFLMPVGVKLTDKAPWNLVSIAADQAWQKLTDEKPAPKKRTPKKTEEM